MNPDFLTLLMQNPQLAASQLAQMGVNAPKAAPVATGPLPAPSTSIPKLPLPSQQQLPQVAAAQGPVANAASKNPLTGVPETSTMNQLGQVLSSLEAPPQQPMPSTPYTTMPTQPMAMNPNLTDMLMRAMAGTIHPAGQVPPLGALLARR